MRAARGLSHVRQDVRFDDRARKELLLRVEECRSKLWFDVEQRKACATETLTRIEENGEHRPHLDCLQNLVTLATLGYAGNRGAAMNDMKLVGSVGLSQSTSCVIVN